MSSTLEPGFWRRVSTLFDAVLDQPTAQRAELLGSLCDDSRLRQAVVNLLRRDRSGASFLDSPPIPAMGSKLRAPAAGPLVGQHLGPYLLRRMVGVGGMSTVFLARRVDGGAGGDSSVAIKVARGEHSRILNHALRRERQILARLSHPYIARFLGDGSTQDGKQFIVLEYIEGIPITQYCDQARHSPKRRLELFCKVCQAIDYAHRCQIIHRDLKPNNILVTDAGVPKVLDFGLAKQLDIADETHSATSTFIRGRFMTPSYASPEQIAGAPASVASDVYSLGVLLFQLLTGLRPWDLEALPVTAHHEGDRTRWLRPSVASTATLLPDQLGSAQQPEIRAETRATTPHQLQRQLHGELDDLVSRCLRRIPEQRYGSAAELQQAITRYLGPD